MPIGSTSQLQQKQISLYKGWTGYLHPVVPIHKIQFADIDSLKTFYRGTHRHTEQGRQLMEFECFQVTRENTETTRENFPGTILKAARDGDGLIPGGVIDEKTALEDGRWFSVQDQDVTVTLRLVEIKCANKTEYTYDENGGVKAATFTSEGKTSRRTA